MFDYTPEGVKYNQNEIAISQLCLLNKKVQKMNRKLTLLSIAGAAFLYLNFKDKIKDAVEKSKGE